MCVVTEKTARNSAYKPLEKGIWGCLHFLHTVLIMEQHWEYPAPPPTPSQETPTQLSRGYCKQGALK